MTGHEILLKPENLQVTGSFKIRGAYNKIASLTEEQLARGIVTASAGNHAQGVAYAARERGAKATICMPQITPAAEGGRHQGVRRRRGAVRRCVRRIRRPRRSS
jgi:threonine dehydratase